MPDLKHELAAADDKPVALVTGSGAPRVGNTIVRVLAERGYRVVVHANTSLADAERTVSDITAGGGEALAIVADIRDEPAVEQMVSRVQAHFGRIDVLVNSAAIWHRRPLEQTTAEDVKQHFEINTLGTFLCCRHVGLLMAKQAGGGSIINLGDWATVRPYRDYAAYFAGKGAIETLTRTMAIELASRNPRVRVNAILPGPVMLPTDLPAAERQASIAGTLVKREGSPAHVAHAVVFLLENDFVTGVCLPVDGGRSICPSSP